MQLDLSADLVWESLDLSVNGIEAAISTVRRNGPSEPILILHGFGSTKEDYLDISLVKDLAGLPFILYDIAGSGQSTCTDYDKVSIPFLVNLAEEVLKHYGIKKFHLAGHSMGGLTALMLAQKHPDAVLSFINIKGNLAPEDCFLSRQVLDYPSHNPDDFFKEFVERTRKSKQWGSGIYASSLPAKVRPEVTRPIFESMVHLSDTEDLLNIFEGLPCPKMFMYGEQYNNLSYLPRLREAGVVLAEIPQAGHFVMYSNQVEMWKRFAEFLKR